MLLGYYDIEGRTTLEGGQSTVRVIIAHRNAAAGHGLALLLAKYGDFDVVGEVADPDEIVATIVNANPNLALVDSEFPSIDLEGIIRLVKERVPDVAVAVFTGSDNWSHLEDSIRAGATSFVSMKTDPEELARSLRLAGDGHVLVSTPLVASLLDLFNGEPAPVTRDAALTVIHDLSQRELEILRLVAHGHTNAEIAESLIIAENTVKVHMRNIFGKLQLRNRQQAAAYALQSGIVADLVFPSVDAG